MRISVGYSLHLVYLFLLYHYKHLKRFRPVKIALRLLPKAILFLCLVLAVIPAKSFADTINKDDNTDNLNLPSSWDGLAAPGAADIAQWESTVTGANATVLGADTTWQGILITNPGGDVEIKAGNTLTLGAAATDIDMTAADVDLTLNCGLSLGDANIWDVATGRTLTVGGNVSNVANLLTVQGAGNTSITGIIGNGAGGLTKDGSGTLTLSGANTYTGLTDVQAGELVLNTTGNNAISGDLTISGTAVTTLLQNNQIADTSTVTVSGGTLNIDTFNDTTSTFNMSAGELAGTGTLTATTYGLSGGTVTANLGTGTMNVTGSTLLDGTSAATAANISAGTLTLGANDRLANGATVTISGTGILDIDSHDDTVNVFNMSAGELAGTGTLTATTYGLSGGTVTAMLGAGDITVDTGTVTLASAGRLNTASNLTIQGGQLTLSGAESTNSYTQTGGILAGDFSLTSASDFDMQAGTVSSILNGAVGLNKTTAGTVTLSGANTYTGLTTLSAGTLNLTGNNTAATGGVTMASGTTLNLGSATALGGTAGTFTINGGTIDNTSGGALTLTTNNAQTWGGDFTFTGTNALNLGTGAVTLTGTRQVTISDNTLTVGGIISGGFGLTKTGAGTLTLNGENTYTGTTTVNAGTLNLNESLTGSPLLTFTGDGTVNLAADKNITGSITTSSTGNGTLNYLGNSTTGSNVGESGAKLKAVNIEAGTLATDYDIYANTTTIKSAAKLDIGSNDITIGGAFDMLGTSQLKLAILDKDTSGSVTTTGAADIPSTVLVDLNITSGQYIPHGTTYTAVDGTGGAAVIGGNTVTDNNPYISFTTTGGSGLVLHASRSSTGFDSWATTQNSKAAGVALEDAGSHSPSSDMLEVLNAVEALSTSEVEGALTQMLPQIDRAAIDTTNTIAVQNIQTMSDHLHYNRAGGSSGVATGDSMTRKDIWIKGFGTHANQNDRKEVEGYRANVLGTAIGADLLVTQNVTAGIGIGYANTDVKSQKSNIGKTRVDTLQGSAYWGYDRPLNHMPGDLLYFNLIGSFGWNDYDASRSVSFGSINKTAKSSYGGQQYTAYAETGYHVPLSSTIDWIPFLSLRYTRLHIDKYKEKDAGALSLDVDSQAYNMCELGLGMKLASKIRTESFDFIPEIRAQWLYDVIADNMQTTSRFTGGGASFKTVGAKPARSTFDLGGSLTFITNKNITVDFDYDYSFRSDYSASDASAVFKFGVLLP